MAVFIAAWRVILKRTRADWLIVSAAALIILLATTLLATGPIYAGAVALSSLHRTLHDAPVTDANVEITTRSRPQSISHLDQMVTAEAQRVFDPTGGAVIRVGRSDSFALPEQADTDTVRLTVLGFYDAIDAHATIVEGAWPDSSDSPVQVAVSDSTAALLGLAIGDELQLPNRRDENFIVPVQVAGIYQIDDPADPYWRNDPLEINGVESGESFTTYGPLVVTSDAFFTAVATSGAEMNWRIFPVFDNLVVDEIPELRSGVQNLEVLLNQATGGRQQFTVVTDLGDLLRDAEESLLVARTGVMILTIQLAVLAGYALVLTAGLLIEQRRLETALLRSRGASTGHIAALALMEALLLAIPAAVLGPWIAALSLRLLNVAGPLEDIELDLAPRVTSMAYALAATTAVACAVALTLPAFRSARSFATEQQSRGRQESRGIAQRIGLDVALLVVAALGYWQLRRYGAPITESVQGRLGLDPFLVAAPALGLLAGAIIALRVIPLIAGAFDRSVARSRRLVPSLGAWQVSRRPLRYTRSALLLMLAIGIGLFAVAYAATWSSSQRDQADYQVGADLRVTPDQRFGRAIPDMNLASAYGQIDGIEQVMPVSRDITTLSRSAGSARVLGIDAVAAQDIVAFRSDLGDAPFDDMLQTLAERRPEVVAITLPGEPQRIALDVQMSLDPLPERAAHPPSVIAPSVDIVLRDGRGMLYRLPVGPLEQDTGSQRLEARLAHHVGDAMIPPEYPLAILGIEMRLNAPVHDPRSGRLDLTAIHVSPSLSGDDWQDVRTEFASEPWRVSVPRVAGLSTAPTAQLVAEGSMLSMQFTTGSIPSEGPAPVAFTARPPSISGQETAEPLAVIVSDRFLALTQSSVGDRIQLVIGVNRREVEIISSVAAFPTVNPDESPVVLVDLPALATAEYERGSRIVRSDEWWLSVDDAHVGRVADVLREPPFHSRSIENRIDRADALRTDPVALGIIGALSIGFVAAALFAAIGFVASAAISARERLAEFALLRALGLSPRQLSGWLSIENGLLVVISLVGGTVLGLLMSWLVLPFITLTQDASNVVPGVIVRIPWRTVLLLEFVLVVALAAMVMILALLLRRVGLGTALRMGEE